MNEFEAERKGKGRRMANEKISHEYILSHNITKSCYFDSNLFLIARLSFYCCFLPFHFLSFEAFFLCLLRHHARILSVCIEISAQFSREFRWKSMRRHFQLCEAKQHRCRARMSKARGIFAGQRATKGGIEKRHRVFHNME